MFKKGYKPSKKSIAKQVATRKKNRLAKIRVEDNGGLYIDKANGLKPAQSIPLHAIPARPKSQAKKPAKDNRGYDLACNLIEAALLLLRKT